MNIFKKFWELHQHHWNWIFLAFSVLVLFLALWFHSLLLTLAGLCFAVGACLKLPEADPPFVFVQKSLKWENSWIKKKWDLRKIFRFFLFLCFVVLLIYVVWENSYISLLFFAGLGINLWCVHANRLMGVDKP